MTDLPRPGERLTDDLVALVEVLAAALPEGESLMRQVREAVVTGASPTMLDVEVPAGCEVVALPAGPQRVLGWWTAPDGEPSEVSIWIDRGRFNGLEQSWYGEAVPVRWPSADEVTVDDVSAEREAISDVRD